MVGKYNTSSMLSLIGAVLILTSVFILAFISYYLSPYWSYYHTYGITTTSLVKESFVFLFICPVLAIVILVGALLANSEKGNKATAGLVIVLVLTLFVFCLSFHF
ncbi:MAG: hypothetical protein QXR97_01950 [Thermoproteota archaeon]